MIKSMTGFGSQEAKVRYLGKVSIEMRSTNHKFLDIVFHLPGGFLSLEDRIKKEIESQTKRGRVVCSINIDQDKSAQVGINKELLKKYIAEFRNIQKEFRIQSEMGLDTLINLPGILSLAQKTLDKESIWPHLKVLVNKAAQDLVRARKKEGKAIYAYLKGQIRTMESGLGVVSSRFKKVIKHRLPQIDSDEERVSFLKNNDITEELDRLTFHAQNFGNKLAGGGAIGKELDFIAQEMQREANTIGAKSCDKVISARVVQIKSQIEKAREQIQNVE